MRGCGVCKEICPLLASHGTPGEILGNNPEDAFLCTNCGACNSICPAGLSPAGLFLRVKQDLIQSGQDAFSDKTKPCRRPKFYYDRS